MRYDLARDAPGLAELGLPLAVREGSGTVIVFLTRERDGWMLRLDSGEPEPPVYCPAAIVCSPSAEAWFRGGEGPGLCAWCQELFLPSRRGQQYCTARCRGAGYREARR